MKRNKVVAPVVVHVRSEASHYPYHHSIGPMLCLLVSLCSLLSLAARPAAAQITVGGDPGEVTPADPSTWTSKDTNAEIGINPGKTGTVTAAGGSSLTAYFCYLGYNTGSTGEVTFDGTRQYSYSYFPQFSIGHLGAGTLEVRNQARLQTDVAYIGEFPGSSGKATVSGHGSIWKNYSGLVVVGYSGAGELTVAAGGVVDSDMFDIALYPGSNGTVTVTDPGSTLTVRWLIKMATGTGSTAALRVENGGAVSNQDGMWLGYYPGSWGTVVVTGPGSTLAERNPMVLHGTIRIEKGGTVNSYLGCVAYTFDTAISDDWGAATIMGEGSTWAILTKLYVGGSGTGTLTIGRGGKAAAGSVIIGANTSALNLCVGGDGMLVLGNASNAAKITNSGKVNLYADAFLAARTYTPITAFQGQTITWSGTGSYNAFGGTWDDGAKTFTVAAATLGDAGVSCDLTSAERLLITDAASGRRVGASFGTVADGTNFTATPVSGDDLIGLPADQPLLAAWNFSTNFAGDQALLAFDVGVGQTEDLAVWHYDGVTWTPFDAFDLTYGDDGIASFAVTGFGGYAVTVPEPASMALILLAGLTVRRRRQQP